MKHVSEAVTLKVFLPHQFTLNYSSVAVVLTSELGRYLCLPEPHLC